MIFVTVGSQLGFERLVAAVDVWAAAHPERGPFFAQVGEGSTPPRSMEWARDLAPEEFDARMDAASLVVGHAGTGTILAALTRDTPIVVLARREGLGETRNDHQVATIERFRAFEGFHGTVDEADVGELIERALDPALPGDGEGAPLAPFASGPLVERLATFLDEHLP